MEGRQGEIVTTPLTQAQTVRAWAKEQGYPVGVRGRLAPHIWEAYAAAHDGFKREIPNATWTCHCGRQWTGLREAHCTQCHRHFASARSFDGHRSYANKRDKEDVVCVDPLSVRIAGFDMKIRDTVWGPVYSFDAGEHYKTDSGNGLYDED